MKVSEFENHSPLYNDMSSLQAIKSNPDQQQALEQAAEQFEAVFLQSVLKHMRQASEALQDESDDNPFNSRQQQFYRSMYDSQLAIEMSRQKSLGISDMLVKQLGHHEAFKPQSQLVAITGQGTALAPQAENSLAQTPVARHPFSPVQNWALSAGPLAEHINNLGDPEEQ
ncbi:rod-binding protein [Photobacterium aquae]|uniref:rod-binding protein n=1 Tax=Photobacterium aquae TaxID=1195763 RepID=UPI00069FECD8|nr:rod-binding protein [Photobacterium aquae]